ncbi:MutS 4 [Nymphon striatum]|nr:MutS 4 [Nymphon striatum]
MSQTQPFQFEPKYATDEEGEESLSSSQSNSEDDEKASRIGEQSWCDLSDRTKDTSGNDPSGSSEASSPCYGKPITYISENEGSISDYSHLNQEKPRNLTITDDFEEYDDFRVPGPPPSVLNKFNAQMKTPAKFLTSSSGINPPSTSSRTSFPSSSPRSMTPLKRFLRSFNPNSTPRSRTIISSTPSGITPAIGPESSVIAALVEGRGLARGEIGMACIDIKNPELILSQFADNSSYAKVLSKLQIHNPIEIIMPHTACESGNMAVLYKQVVSQFPNIQISLVQRKYFNEVKGMDNIKDVCVPEYNTVIMEIKTKYYCLATAAALLRYLEYIKNIAYANASLKVLFKGIDKTTMIDATTARNLELITNLRSAKSQESLYGVLNYTKTFGGARLLRANILQPPCDENTVNTRLDCVSELLNNQEMFFAIQSVLSRFVDVGNLLCLFIQVPKQETLRIAERKIVNVIQLKHTLELINQLKTALENAVHPIFKAFIMVDVIYLDESDACIYFQLLEDQRYHSILEKIRTIVHNDTHYQKGALTMRTQKCFAVKANINGLLDIARRTYTENIDDITVLIRQLSEKYNLPLKTTYNASQGFVIQIYTGGKIPVNLSSLPSCFIKISKKRNHITCTTEDMVCINMYINEHSSFLHQIMTELVQDIRKEIGCLYKLSEAVCTLDLLVSLSHACSISNYVRPEFTDTLAVKNGIHPILKKVLSEGPTPNDSSGKSTYLKQMACLQIMAQLGSFVPAEYASFRITDQIFSRIGNSDDMEANCSTFMVEMREMNYILQNLTDRSLVVIDELGRGTSIEEGIGICWAIAEILIESKAFVFFATHFRELAQLDMYPNVQILQFKADEETEESNKNLKTAGTSKIKYTHQLWPGFTEVEHYGIKLAGITDLPKTIIDEAKVIVGNVEDEQENYLNKQYENEKNMVNVANKILQAANNCNTDGDNMKQLLINLQESCISIQVDDSAEGSLDLTWSMYALATSAN